MILIWLAKFEYSQAARLIFVYFECPFGLIGRYSAMSLSFGVQKLDADRGSNLGAD